MILLMNLACVNQTFHHNLLLPISPSFLPLPKWDSNLHIYKEALSSYEAAFFSSFFLVAAISFSVVVCHAEKKRKKLSFARCEF